VTCDSIATPANAASASCSMRLRVIAVARQVHEAGVEPVKDVAAHEQPDLGPLVQVDDAAHDAHQVRDRRLEQFVARVSLEYVGNRLAVVARRLQPELLDDALHLEAQHRNFPGALAVRR
jgi:hypothetical protein